MVKWIQLVDFQCPACPDKRGGNWICASHGNPVYLNENGVMECSTTCTGKVINWRWNCGSSYHNGEYLKADLEGFTFALSQAVQLMTKGGSEWTAKLITELGKQYGQ
ncbi:uncharacterized protein LOC128554596 [Mercenaria mercenaria]|uniref:uncharacterized protein LOC128554596 n=1 Tax=Mercenaria mercenaria TaxID=6596 RepID=UPI00234F752B|nr:uncharacterized protein LOC128554596 [Mercenaria mercenaria]